MLIQDIQTKINFLNLNYYFHNKSSKSQDAFKGVCHMRYKWLIENKFLYTHLYIITKQKQMQQIYITKQTSVTYIIFQHVYNVTRQQDLRFFSLVSTIFFVTALILCSYRGLQCISWLQAGYKLWTASALGTFSLLTPLKCPYWAWWGWFRCQIWFVVKNDFVVVPPGFTLGTVCSLTVKSSIMATASVWATIFLRYCACMKWTGL